MLKFTAELEDVCFEAVRSTENISACNKEGEWTVKLFPSEQAKKDFPEEATETAELNLNDEELGALLYLSSAGDTAMHSEEMYEVLEPKLAGIPYSLRPIP